MDIEWGSFFSSLSLQTASTLGTEEYGGRNEDLEVGLENNEYGDGDRNKEISDLLRYFCSPECDKGTLQGLLKAISLCYFEA